MTPPQPKKRRKTATREEMLAIAKKLHGKMFNRASDVMVAFGYSRNSPMMDTKLECPWHLVEYSESEGYRINGTPNSICPICAPDPLNLPPPYKPPAENYMPPLTMKCVRGDEWPTRSFKAYLPAFGIVDAKSITFMCPAEHIFTLDQWIKTPDGLPPEQAPKIIAYAKECQHHNQLT